MKMKLEKSNKNLVVYIIIIIAVILIAIGVIVWNRSKEKVMEIDEGGGEPMDTPISTVVDTKEQILSHTSTEEMKGQAPLINMNNTENATIQNGEKVNTSEYMKKEKELSGLKLSDIVLHTESGVSTFNATVENTADEDFKGEIVNLVFKKSDGSTLATVEALIPAVEAKGTTIINVSTTRDIVNAIDVEIEFGEQLKTEQVEEQVEVGEQEAEATAEQVEEEDEPS